ncbi:MAG: dihydrofolate reductase [Actinomycetaceae bacterium]|nr:dihydrofolate reductase [Actinomycetaceae bacterium]
MTTIALIWAQDNNAILGTGTDMCWHVPEDFKHFKQSTMGSPIIMGRASFEALGKPLPGRTNIVVTRQKNFVSEGVVVVHSLEQAIKAAGDVPLVWITGGGSIYRQSMPIADKLVVTYLDLDVKAKTTGAKTTDSAHTPDDVTANNDNLTGDKTSFITTNDEETYVYAPDIDPGQWQELPEESDTSWREKSGDAHWKVITYIRKCSCDTAGLKATGPASKPNKPSVPNKRHNPTCSHNLNHLNDLSHPNNPDGPCHPDSAKESLA